MPNRTDWAWQDHAACRGEDLRLFFGPDGEQPAARKKREAKAKRICRRCPVAMACLDGAVTRGEQAGVWGGQSEAGLADLVARARRIWEAA